MQTTLQTPDEMEAATGEKLKALRLQRNLDQVTVAARAGVSVRALRNLEAGNGSTLHTFVAVLRALGLEGWLESLAPVASINPLTLPRHKKARLRATTRARSSPPKTPPAA